MFCNDPFMLRTKLDPFQMTVPLAKILFPTDSDHSVSWLLSHVFAYLLGAGTGLKDLIETEKLMEIWLAFYYKYVQCFSTETQISWMHSKPNWWETNNNGCSILSWSFHSQSFSSPFSLPWAQPVRVALNAHLLLQPLILKELKFSFRALLGQLYTITFW